MEGIVGIRKALFYSSMVLGLRRAPRMLLGPVCWVYLCYTPQNILLQHSLHLPSVHLLHLTSHGANSDKGQWSHLFIRPVFKLSKGLPCNQHSVNSNKHTDRHEVLKHYISRKSFIIIFKHLISTGHCVISQNILITQTFLQWCWGWNPGPWVC